MAMKTRMTFGALRNGMVFQFAATGAPAPLDPVWRKATGGRAVSVVWAPRRREWVVTSPVEVKEVESAVRVRAVRS